MYVVLAAVIVLGLLATVRANVARRRLRLPRDRLALVPVAVLPQPDPETHGRRADRLQGPHPRSRSRCSRSGRSPGSSTPSARRSATSPAPTSSTAAATPAPACGRPGPAGTARTAQRRTPEESDERNQHGAGHHPRPGRHPQPGLATIGFTGELLGLGAARPARPGHQGAARAELRRAVTAGRRAGHRRLARPDPGRRAHRPVRRSDHVPGRQPGHDRAGADARLRAVLVLRR